MRIVAIACTECATESSFAFWETVNVTTYPELKTRVLSGELFVFTCDACAYQAQLLAPFLYHDMAGLMVYVVPEGIDEADGDATAGPPPPEPPPVPTGDGPSRYRLRLARSLDELEEKVVAFDAGLDDRVLEILKAALEVAIAGRDDGGAEDPDPAPEREPWSRAEFETREPLVQFTMTDDGDGSKRRAAVGRDEYARWEAALREGWAPAPDSVGDWLRVDAEYGRRAYAALA